jgi:hypothetical protein
MKEQSFSDQKMIALLDQQQAVWVAGDQVALGHVNELLLAETQAREDATTVVQAAPAHSTAPKAPLSLQDALDLQREAFRTHDQSHLELANTMVMHAVNQRHP